MGKGGGIFGFRRKNKNKNKQGGAASASTSTGKKQTEELAIAPLDKVVRHQSLEEDCSNVDGTVDANGTVDGATERTLDESESQPAVEGKVTEATTASATGTAKAIVNVNVSSESNTPTPTSTPTKFKAPAVRGNKIAERTARLQQGYQKDQVFGSPPTTLKPASGSELDATTTNTRPTAGTAAGTNTDTNTSTNTSTNTDSTPPRNIASTQKQFWQERAFAEKDTTTATTAHSTTSSTPSQEHPKKLKAKTVWLQGAFTPTGGGNMPNLDDVLAIETIAGAAATAQQEETCRRRQDLPQALEAGQQQDPHDIHANPRTVKHCQGDPYQSAYKVWYQKGLIHWCPTPHAMETDGDYQHGESLVTNAHEGVQPAGSYHHTNSIVLERSADPSESAGSEITPVTADAAVASPRRSAAKEPIVVETVESGISDTTTDESAISVDSVNRLLDHIFAIDHSVGMESFNQDAADAAEPAVIVPVATSSEGTVPVAAAAVVAAVTPETHNAPSSPARDTVKGPSVIALAAAMNQKYPPQHAAETTPKKRTIPMSHAVSCALSSVTSPESPTRSIARDDPHRDDYIVWNHKGLLKWIPEGADPAPRPEPNGTYEHGASVAVSSTVYEEKNFSVAAGQAMFSGPANVVEETVTITTAVDEASVISNISGEEEEKEALDDSTPSDSFFVFVKDTKRKVPRAPVLSWFGGAVDNLADSVPETLELPVHFEDAAAAPSSIKSPSAERVAAYKYVAESHQTYVKNRTSPEAVMIRRQALDRLQEVKCPENDDNGGYVDECLRRNGERKKDDTGGYVDECLRRNGERKKD